MKIAVLGAGNVGAGLARSAAAAGHTVVITASTPEKAAAVAADTGATAGASNVDAVAGADLVVLAVPHPAVAGVAAEIADAAAGIPLVDATNPLNATYSDLDIEGDSAAADLQAAVPRSPVVKAFNTVFASRYAAPAEDGRALPVLIAGDDDAAKTTVAELATSLGFQSLDVGGLRHARGLEELAFLNIALNASNGWSWQSAWTLVGPSSLS
jgi:8-hydroxy-5-deazaflavin:NADPH oxidoreductase